MKRCAYCDERLIFDPRRVGRNGKMIPLNRIDGRERFCLSQKNPINRSKIKSEKERLMETSVNNVNNTTNNTLPTPTPYSILSTYDRSKSQ